MSRIYIQDWKFNGRPYILKETLKYYSERYDKWITVFANDEDRSDGATYAKDINSKSWWVHDKICRTGVFDDGTKLSNWQASMICSDILREEDRYLRSFTWFIGTFIGGGGQCRKNGMFRV